jgi:hypothetical protein
MRGRAAYGTGKTSADTVHASRTPRPVPDRECSPPAEQLVKHRRMQEACDASTVIGCRCRSMAAVANPFLATLCYMFAWLCYMFA